MGAQHRGAEAVDDELPLLMLRAVKAMVAEVRSMADRAPVEGLTAVHGVAVRYLDRHEHVTLVELADHLGMTKQSASELVGALEREGYVRRLPHPTDGRARILELTDEGRAGLRRSRAR